MNLTDKMRCAWCYHEGKDSGANVMGTSVPGWGWIAVCESHRQAWIKAHTPVTGLVETEPLANTDSAKKPSL